MAWTRLTTLMAAMLLVTPGASRAAWVAAPFETHLIEADLVVVGRVAAVNEGFKRVRDYSLARLEVGEVLKGKVPEGGIDLAFPARFLVAGDMVYKVGDEGVWILKQDAEAEFYWAASAMDRQPMKSAGPLKTAVKGLAELTWGAEANGLKLLCKGQLAADLPLGTPPPKPGERGANAPAVPAVAFFVKNVSDHPLYVCTFAGDKPVRVTAVGPDEKPIKLEPYLVAWRAALSKASFLYLRPGQVRSAEGVGGAFKLPMFPQSGKYGITATFKAQRDGKAFKLEPTWTGELTSNTQSVDFTLVRPGE